MRAWPMTTAVPSTASRLQELHDTDTSSPDSPRDVGDFMALVKQQLRWEDMLKALKAESQKLEGALKRTGADVRKKLNQKKRDLEAKVLSCRARCRPLVPALSPLYASLSAYQPTRLPSFPTPIGPEVSSSYALCSLRVCLPASARSCRKGSAARQSR